MAQFKCNTSFHNKATDFENDSPPADVMKKVRVQSGLHTETSRKNMSQDKIKVKIINRSGYDLPAYETPSSAGMDIRAAITEPLVLGPLERTLVPTGLRVELPRGYEMQIRPRSGLALRNGISLVNTPGTVDADYRGEIGVILINLSNEPFTVNPGERIAQMVISAYTKVEWEPTRELDRTVRGDGAFGHTGLE